MAERLSLQKYADHRKAKGLSGTTHTAVLQAIKQGRITQRAYYQTPSKRYKIDADIADAEWARHTDPGRGGNGLPPATPDMAEEELRGVPNRNVSRAIREAYMARLARVEFERETGLRVLADDVKKEAFEQARKLRDALMNIPDRLAHDMAAETDAGVIHLAISEAIRETLETFIKQ